MPCLICLLLVHYCCLSLVYSVQNRDLLSLTTECLICEKTKNRNSVFLVFTDTRRCQCLYNKYCILVLNCLYIWRWHSFLSIQPHLINLFLSSFCWVKAELPWTASFCCSGYHQLTAPDRTVGRKWSWYFNRSLTELCRECTACHWGKIGTRFLRWLSELLSTHWQDIRRTGSTTEQEASPQALL